MISHIPLCWLAWHGSSLWLWFAFLIASHLCMYCAGHLYVFFGERCVEIRCPFRNCVLLIFEFLPYFGYKSHVRYVVCAYLFLSHGFAFAFLRCICAFVTSQSSLSGVCSKARPHVLFLVPGFGGDCLSLGGGVKFSPHSFHPTL